jgi:NAD(P)H-dependent FMN reductase
MKKILAFAGSNSSTSINKEFLNFAVHSIAIENEKIDLSDFDVPLYGIDAENEDGIPENTKKLHHKINSYQFLIISVNEHNGGASVFFKNQIDWLSRYDRNFLKDKKILLLSTSPGRGGAQMALEWASTVLPRFGAEVVSRFSLVSFNHSYSSEKGIYDTDQKLNFDKALQEFIHQIEA